MKKYEIYKYKIKAKLNRETDEYMLDRRTNGKDFFETIMFAVEAVTRDLIESELVKDKKDFLKHMGNTYDIIKEDMNNVNN